MVWYDMICTYTHIYIYIHAYMWDEILVMDYKPRIRFAGCTAHPSLPGELRLSGFLGHYARSNVR